MPIAVPLRLLFIVNPASGNGGRQAMEQDIRSYFKDTPHQIELYELTGNDDDASIRYWMDTWKPDRVVAAGGDGTLKAVATLMKGGDIPLGILPAGSANGMARELGIPEDIGQCLDIVTGGYSKRIDLVCINEDELCLHLSDFGLNARLVKQFEESDRRGMWGYAREVWKVLRSRELLHVQVKTAARTVSRKAWMVVVANARMYGTGAMINPKGDVSDGLFEIILLRRLSVWELLKMLVRNRRFDARKTELIQTDSASISIRENSHFQVDGEYLGTLSKINVSILPASLLLLLPAPAAA